MLGVRGAFRGGVLCWGGEGDECATGFEVGGVLGTVLCFSLFFVLWRKSALAEVLGRACLENEVIISNFLTKHERTTPVPFS